MTGARAYFVSDVHLRTMEERNSQKLLRFFYSVLSDPQKKPTHLFLVGDIFDLWIGKHEYFVKRFRPIVDAIHEMVKAGVEVHYFEGNHDLYLKDFWENELGVKVHADESYFQLGDTLVRVEHGDMINPEDKGYLFLRAFLRSGPLKLIARNLSAKLINSIGEKASRASRQYTSTSKELPATEIRTLIRSYAERAYDEKPFDLIVTGHVHVDDDHLMLIQDKPVRSVNLGSWYDSAHVLMLETPPLNYRFIPVE